MTETTKNEAAMAAPDQQPETPEKDAFSEERQAILKAMLARAAFDGWTEAALSGAARDAGVSSANLAAAFPEGVADALRAWSDDVDRAMTAAMAAPAFQSLKIREKVTAAIRARLDVLRPHKEAARRAAATLALPIFGTLGARLAWKTADAVWRGMNDSSTDFNFYSKRAILSGVWLSTLTRWLADEDEDESQTHAFLDARIENVMQIEKGKAKLRDLNLDPRKPIEWLARLRYPANS